MNTPAKFKEYVWLVNTIRKARKITLAEINRRWLENEMSEGIELARSTFNRHKDAIEDIFGIIIDCDRQDGYRYYISNDEVLLENTVQNWMLSTLSVQNLISEHLSLQHRILLESVPSEGEYLKLVLEAMKKNVRIVVDYRKYGSDEVRVSEFDPYCLKLFKQRWYVLGHFSVNADWKNKPEHLYAVYSLDRVLKLELTDTRFEVHPSFDAKDFFSECFGVVAGDGTRPEKIVLRAYGQERFYLRDLPLHASQKMVRRDENYTDFELFMRPTKDFCGHLMSRGHFLKVLKPEWLAREMAQLFRQALEQYQVLEES